jgi:hypothetical protein
MRLITPPLPELALQSEKFAKIKGAIDASLLGSLKQFFRHRVAERHRSPFRVLHRSYRRVRHVRGYLDPGRAFRWASTRLLTALGRNACEPWDCEAQRCTGTGNVTFCESRRHSTSPSCPLLRGCCRSRRIAPRSRRHRHQIIPALSGGPAAPALPVQPAPALSCHGPRREKKRPCVQASHRASLLGTAERRVPLSRLCDTLPTIHNVADLSPQRVGNCRSLRPWASLGQTLEYTRGLPERPPARPDIALKKVGKHAQRGSAPMRCRGQVGESRRRRTRCIGFTPERTLRRINSPAAFSPAQTK